MEQIFVREEREIASTSCLGFRLHCPPQRGDLILRDSRPYPGGLFWSPLGKSIKKVNAEAVSAPASVRVGLLVSARYLIMRLWTFTGAAGRWIWGDHVIIYIWRFCAVSLDWITAALISCNVEETYLPEDSQRDDLHVWCLFSSCSDFIHDVRTRKNAFWGPCSTNPKVIAVFHHGTSAKVQVSLLNWGRVHEDLQRITSNCPGGGSHDWAWFSDCSAWKESWWRPMM